MRGKGRRTEAEREREGGREVKEVGREGERDGGCDEREGGRDGE